MPDSFDFTIDDATSLMNEADRVRARMASVDAERGRLKNLLARILERLDQVVGNRGKSTDQVIREIKANIKRSATRIIRERRQQGRTPDEARAAARGRALVVANRYHFSSLPESSLKHIEDELRRTYENDPNPIRKRP